MALSSTWTFLSSNLSEAKKQIQETISNVITTNSLMSNCPQGVLHKLERGVNTPAVANLNGKKYKHTLD